MEKDTNPAEELKNSIDTAIETKGNEVAAEAKDALETTKTELEGQLLHMSKSIDDVAASVKDFASASTTKNVVIEDTLLKSLRDVDFTDVKSGNGTASLEIKTLSYGSTGVEANVPFEYRVEDIKHQPHHRTRARSIVMTGMTEGDVVRFNQSQDTASSNPAAGKAHGASFASYTTQLNNIQAKVETYGATIVLNEEQLDDVLGLRSFISNQLMGYLLDTEDAYILEGSGSSNTFTGIYTAGTTFAATQVIGATANLYDVLLDSAAQLAANNYNLNCVVLNAVDFWHLSTIKTSTGQYALRTFNSEFGPKVMGGDIYWNNGITAGNFVAFDKMATQFWMREGAVIEFFRANDDFTKNNVTARVKARGCVTNFLPGGIIKGVIATAITDLTS